MEEPFNNLIKVRRERLKLTQRDVAEMSGITERTLYKIEHGIGAVTLPTMEKLCEVLGLEIIIRPKIN